MRIAGIAIRVLVCGGILWMVAAALNERNDAMAVITATEEE